METITREKLNRCLSADGTLWLEETEDNVVKVYKGDHIVFLRKLEDKGNDETESNNTPRNEEGLTDEN